MKIYYETESSFRYIKSYPKDNIEKIIKNLKRRGAIFIYKESETEDGPPLIVLYEKGKEL